MLLSRSSNSSERWRVDVPLCELIREIQDASEDDREAVAVLEQLLNALAWPMRLRLFAALAAAALTAMLVLSLPSPVQADEETQPPADQEAQPLPATEETPVSAQEEASGITLLPSRALFDPLLADVRWPRFSAEYQHYNGDKTLNNVGSANFGGLLPVIQGPLPSEGRWEIAAQAGVFSIFDLDSDSHDLINADYWFGVPFTARWGWFSAMLRVYHQSSHLGDEFLLRHQTNRVNLSYEAVDLIPSIDLWNWGRIYGGYGYLFSRDPSDLKPAYWQLGGELKSPVAFFGWLRPIAALDMKRTQEQGWSTDYSARAGIQFENEKIFKSRRLLLLAEYYKGHSPNGQFFDDRIQFWGVGLHFFF